MPLIIKAWLFFHKCYSTGIELMWLPRNCGSKRDSNSSIMRLPLVGLAKLKVKSKYSGINFNGCSKMCLTLLKWWDADRVMSLSTRSILSHTCSISGWIFSLIPASSSTTSYLRVALVNMIVFSFFSRNAVIVLSMKLIWRLGFAHSRSNNTCNGNCKFWGLLLLNIWMKYKNAF